MIFFPFPPPSSPVFWVDSASLVTTSAQSQICCAHPETEHTHLDHWTCRKTGWKLARRAPAQAFSHVHTLWYSSSAWLGSLLGFSFAYLSACMLLCNLCLRLRSTHTLVGQPRIWSWGFAQSLLLKNKSWSPREPLVTSRRILGLRNL